jgi:hypothetical protein
LKTSRTSGGIAAKNIKELETKKAKMAKSLAFLPFLPFLLPSCLSLLDLTLKYVLT